MKKTLLQIQTVSIGIVLTTGLSNGQTETSPAPATNRVAVAALNITLAEQAATVRQIAEDASKGFDPAKHAQDLPRRINEILAANETAVPINGKYPDLIELHNASASTTNTRKISSTPRFKW